MWMVCFSQSHKPGSGDSQLSITWRFSVILQCWRTLLDLFALLGCHQSCDGECCKSFHIFEKMNYIDDIFNYSNVINVTHGNCDTNMRISIPFWQSWSWVHLDFIIGDDFCWNKVLPWKVNNMFLSYCHCRLLKVLQRNKRIYGDFKKIAWAFSLIIICFISIESLLLFFYKKISLFQHILK